MRQLRTPALFLSLGAAACSGTVLPGDASLQGTVVLSRDAGDAGSVITGTFRSVVDSLALSINAGGTSQRIGHHFGPGESSVTIPVTLPAGVAQVSAEIVSNNKTLLFSGSSTPTIDHDGFSIDMPLAAKTPVLVVLPDSVRLDSTTTRTRSASVTVHNSGSDGLSWSVARDTTGTGFICGLGCQVTPASGLLIANADVRLTFTMPTLTPAGGGYPAGSFTYVFASKQGSVTVQWRYPASP